MTMIGSILRDFNEIPIPQLFDVARYVHSLNTKSTERGLAALPATAGHMDSQEGELFEKAV